MTESKAFQTTAEGLGADLEEITQAFDLIDTWEDRYRYLIELGRELTTLSHDAYTDAHRVPGCASRVWLVTTELQTGGNTTTSGPRLEFQGDSDAHIVKGLIRLLVAYYSGRSAADILRLDPEDLFGPLELRTHLTAQRANGLAAMVRRIRNDAERALSSPERDDSTRTS